MLKKPVKDASSTSNKTRATNADLNCICNRWQTIKLMHWVAYHDQMRTAPTAILHPNWQPAVAQACTCVQTHMHTFMHTPTNTCELDVSYAKHHDFKHRRGKKRLLTDFKHKRKKVGNWILTSCQPAQGHLRTVISKWNISKLFPYINPFSSQIHRINSYTCTHKQHIQMSI